MIDELRSEEKKKRKDKRKRGKSRLPGKRQGTRKCEKKGFSGTDLEDYGHLWQEVPKDGAKPEPFSISGHIPKTLGKPCLGKDWAGWKRRYQPQMIPRWKRDTDPFDGFVGAEKQMPIVLFGNRKAVPGPFGRMRHRAIGKTHIPANR